MLTLPYQGVCPEIHDEVFVAPGAAIIGDVKIDSGSSIWFNVVVRGDVNHITIGKRTNIQDGSVVHVTSGTHPTELGNDVTVGHHAVLHGCRIEDGCLIGINASVLDGAVVGSQSLVAAGSVVTPGSIIPPGSFVLGTPARVVRPLSEQERAKLLVSANNYVVYAQEYLLQSAPEGRGETN